MVEKEKNDALNETRVWFVGVNLGMAALTSLVCLLPIILAVAIYDKLPEQVVMQWNFAGEPNWYAPKAVLAFGMPLFFTVFNVFMNLIIANPKISNLMDAADDPKRESIPKIMRIFTVWSMPLVSLVIMPIALLTNIGVELPVVKIVFSFCGLILIFCGNYMPKNRQNYIVGIRTPWTLKDADNWNKTHRLSGILFIVGGISLIVSVFLPVGNTVGTAVFLCIAALICVVPLVYSYCLYRRSKRGKI